MLFTVTKGKSNSLVVRYHLHIELWKPYTSALQPEDLEIEVMRLPLVRLVTEDGQTQGHRSAETLNNEPRTDNPLVLVIPFRDNPNWFGEDDHFRLPGRIYSWIISNNASGDAPKSENRGEAQFYSRVMNDRIWEQEVGGVFSPEPTGQHSRSSPPVQHFSA